MTVIAATTKINRWTSRVVRRGVIRIAGATYRPARTEGPYDGRLDGRRCLFNYRPRFDGTRSPLLTLWGVWDPANREYLAIRGPHCVDGRYHEVWAEEEGMV